MNFCYLAKSTSRNKGVETQDNLHNVIKLFEEQNLDFSTNLLPFGLLVVSKSLP